MKSENQEVIDAFNAFITIEEITAFDGKLDRSKDESERAQRLADAKQTVTEIATKKGVTEEELYQKVFDIIKRILAEQNS